LNLVPKIIKAQLDGDLKVLKPWLGEAVYNKLAADVRVRKSEGISIDSTILNIDENGIFMKLMDDGRAVIVVVYMVQQINCIKKKGEIIEVKSPFHFDPFVLFLPCFILTIGIRI
jgi:import inner membrane translocase subunit TIM44